MSTSRTGLRLGGFAAGVAVVFGAAYGVGQVVGPVVDEPAAPTRAAESAESAEKPAHGHDGAAAPAAGSDKSAAESSGEHGDSPAGEVSTPAGLQVSEGGATLKVLSTGHTAGGGTDFAFRILDADGHAITSFEPTHDKLMHLVVARRDLSGFQHVHPVMSADGTWRVPLTFSGAGDHRVFADFLPTGRAEGLTLGVDVPVAGAYTPAALPEPARTATVDGYQVTLAGELTPGATSKLALSVAKDGVPVTDLQPYLAAYGHLIALRQGDLAYLHVHPEGTPGDGRTAAGPGITFFAEVPSEGAYRLYLDFKHGEVVRTAEFTAVAGGHGH